MTADTHLRKRLGDILVEAKVLTLDQLYAALNQQRETPGPRRRLGELLVEQGYADERMIALALAAHLGLGTTDLSRNAPAPDVVRLLPQQVAERARCLVVDRTETGLVVAVSDPTDVLALDDVKLHTGAPELTVLVATDGQIRDHLARAWALGQDDGDVSAMVDTSEDVPEEAQLTLGGSDADAPIVKLVNRVLADAVRLGASDIHVETQRDSLRVRFRVDGLLRDVTSTSRRVAPSVISRLKIMSGLDIAERRVPQDGRARIVVDHVPVDCRVSTLPGLHGEKVVIRLLTRGTNVPKLDEVGFEPRQLDVFRSALAAPQGLVLITGPTGSGKTNTLYSAIAEILTPQKNIVTLEDPVEVQLPGITQVQVNTRAGMTFQAGLRSILRQDPDIVLVGEVRDGETAELALKASLTGHLVLTTLHTNSAVAALTRLVDMGAEPFLVASSLAASVAQRLVRRPCPTCSEGYIPDETTLGLLGLRIDDILDATPLRGTGCPECGDTGYRGRIGVYEVLEVDGPMRQILMKNPSESAVGAQARAAGMLTLRAAAIEKAKRGETTFEEALRVTHTDQHVGGRHCGACRRPVESDMVVCPWCTATLDRGHCAACSRSLDPDWRICPWCRSEPPPLAA